LKLPSKIALTFDDPLLTLGKTAINRVVVTDPTGVVITSGIDVVKGAVVTDAFKAGQSSRGKYTVSYRVSALDGHIVTGKFTFTLK
jgi:methionine-rich copper-binding protein CopC